MESPLLQSLFDDEQQPRPLTVSELNFQVKSELERRFTNVWVEGEIVNFADARSGHWYFTLHDGASQLRAVCYKGSNYRIRFQPFDGLQVRVRGRLTLYEPRGEYQMLVESLKPVGEGALRIAYEQIKAKLEAEGLFDEALKRLLPPFPRKIGVVTSPTGAAFFDILHVLSRRARSVSIVLIPARVQGEMAGEEICRAITSANEYNRNLQVRERIDVLIVGRGGGSSEDFWAFNEEIVARTIRLSEIPVISAVGHEIDFTIADFVSDLRAATPSAAAEMVAQREEDLEAYITGRTDDLIQLIRYKMLESANSLQELAMSPVFVEFPNDVLNLRFDIGELDARLKDILAQKLASSKIRLGDIVSQLSPLQLASKVSGNLTRLAVLKERHRAAGYNLAAAKLRNLKISMAKLDALSPLSVLDRGFSITEKDDGAIVRDPQQVRTGENLRIRVAKGEIRTKVVETE